MVLDLTVSTKAILPMERWQIVVERGIAARDVSFDYFAESLFPAF